MFVKKLSKYYLIRQSLKKIYFQDTTDSKDSQSHSTGSPHSFAMELMRGVVTSLEQQTPTTTISGPLPHQSKSYPSGCQPRLVRTPSISSQGSFDGNYSRQVTMLALLI